MNKAELIDAVSATTDLSKKDATAAVEAVLDIIKRKVAKGDKVSLSGFGLFDKSERPAHTVLNPQTGATVQIAATSVPRFRAGAEFKKQVSHRGRFENEEGWMSLPFPFYFSRIPPNQPGIVAYSWLDSSYDTLVSDLMTALMQMVQKAGVVGHTLRAFGQRKIYYRPVYDIETLRELDDVDTHYNASRSGRPYKFSDDREFNQQCPRSWGIYRIKRNDKTAYVGLATNVLVRLSQHIVTGTLSFDRGDYVEVILAERSSTSRLILWDNLAAAERVHIQKTKDLGFTLDNTTDGGNGRTPNYGVNN